LVVKTKAKKSKKRKQKNKKSKRTKKKHAKHNFCFFQSSRVAVEKKKKKGTSYRMAI